MILLAASSTVSPSSPQPLWVLAGGWGVAVVSAVLAWRAQRESAEAQRTTAALQKEATERAAQDAADAQRVSAEKQAESTRLQTLLSSYDDFTKNVRDELAASQKALADCRTNEISINAQLAQVRADLSAASSDRARLELEITRLRHQVEGNRKHNERSTDPKPPPGTVS